MYSVVLDLIANWLLAKVASQGLIYKIILECYILQRKLEVLEGIYPSLVNAAISFFQRITIHLLRKLKGLDDSSE